MPFCTGTAKYQKIQGLGVSQTGVVAQDQLCDFEQVTLILPS